MLNGAQRYSLRISRLLYFAHEIRSECLSAAFLAVLSFPKITSGRNGDVTRTGWE